MTFGWSRLSVLGSLGSLVFLASLHFATGVECLQSLLSSHDHHGGMKLDMSFEVVVMAGAHFATWIAVFFAMGGEGENAIGGNPFMV